MPELLFPAAILFQPQPESFRHGFGDRALCTSKPCGHLYPELLLKLVGEKHVESSHEYFLFVGTLICATVVLHS